jgi:hypothetical protein
MAHGRKRSFIGGMAVGFAFTLISLAVLIYGLDITFGPPGYPHFTERSAREAVIEWSRVSDFPKDAESFSITTKGNMFTRQFRVSFFGEPKAISDWVRGCPGISDPKTTQEISDDGTVTYEIRTGGGAAFAELIHHPTRGTVVIRTYWS